MDKEEDDQEDLEDQEENPDVDGKEEAAEDEGVWS